MSSPSSRRSPRRSSIADEEVDELESSEDELLLVPETKARSSTHLHSPVPRKRSKSTSRAKRAKHTHESSPPLFSDAIEAASDVEAEAEAEAEIDGDAETGDDPDGRRWQCEWMDCKDEFGRQGKLVKHLVHGHIHDAKAKEAEFACLWRTCKRRGERQATRHSLITHCRAHTGERPYTCPQPGCNKTFTRSDAMTKHMRLKHDYVTLQSKRQQLGAAPAAAPPSASTSAIDLPDEASAPAPAQEPEMKKATKKSSKSKKKGQSQVKGQGRGAGQDALTFIDEGAALGLAPIDMLESPVLEDATVPVPVPKHLPVQAVESRLAIVEAFPREDEVLSYGDRLGPGTPYRYGEPTDLLCDTDIAPTIRRIFLRPALPLSDIEASALRYMRRLHPRVEGDYNANLPAWLQRDLPVHFDGGTGELPPEVGRISSTTEHPNATERVVYHRSKLAERYINAKAQLMLEEEEQAMRIKEWSELLDVEAGLDAHLAQLGRRHDAAVEEIKRIRFIERQERMSSKNRDMM